MFISRNAIRASLALAVFAAAGLAASPDSADAARKTKAAARFGVVAGPAGEIRAGTPVNGSLAGGDSVLAQDSSYVDVWRYAGRAGERVTVSMASRQFDTFLMVGLAGQSLGVNDDAPGKGTNSQVTVTLPVTGWYTVAANALRRGGKGAYTLSLRSEAAAAPAGDWAREYPGGGDPGERYAVVVGVDRYPPSLSANLEGPAADARLMRSLLVETYGFRPENVLLLLDAQASRERILAAAERHLGQAGPDGVAVFYYSGHGARLEENLGAADPEPDGKDEALLVWGPDAGSVILDDELGELSDRLPAGRALFVLDACHSGTARSDTTAKRLVEYAPERRSDEARDSWLAAPDAAAGRRRILLTASRDDEVSWISRAPWPSGRNESVFTHYLVEQLREAPERETFGAVMGRVRAATVTYAKTNFGKVQTPQLEGARGDDAVHDFLRKR